jgi:Zn-dependent M16 (insulinase) family peptidase
VGWPLLQERQEKPDEPEALRCIPSLALDDIPKEASTIPTAQVRPSRDRDRVSHRNISFVHNCLNGKLDRASFRRCVFCSDT